MAQAYDEESIQELSSMERPIPGESLTNDPDNPYPFEGPTQYSELREALEAIFTKIIVDETYVQLMTILAKREYSIMEVTQMLLYQGFTQGLWNPDLMLLLIEPTAYMVMALAEQAQINFDITDDDYGEDDAEESFLGVSHDNEKLKNIKAGNFSIPPALLPQQMEERIEELPTLEETEEQPSLLAPPETTQG